MHILGNPGSFHNKMAIKGLQGNILWCLFVDYKQKHYTETESENFSSKFIFYSIFYYFVLLKDDWNTAIEPKHLMVSCMWKKKVNIFPISVLVLESFSCFVLCEGIPTPCNLTPEDSGPAERENKQSFKV